MQQFFLMNHRNALIGICVIGIALIVRITVTAPSSPVEPPPEHALEAPRDWMKSYDSTDTQIRVGDVLTSMGLESIYYVAPTMQRYVFPNQATFQTWYPVPAMTVKNVDRKALEAIPLAGSVTYRPGMRMIKFATDPQYYVVSKGGVLHAATPSILKKLYGTDWMKRVDPLEEYYRADYTISTAITSSSDYSPFGEYNSSPTISLDKGLVPSLK